MNTDIEPDAIATSRNGASGHPVHLNNEVDDIETSSSKRNRHEDLASRTARRRNEQGDRLPSGGAYSTAPSDTVPVEETPLHHAFDALAKRFPVNAQYTRHFYSHRYQNRVRQHAALVERLYGERDQANADAKRVNAKVDEEFAALSTEHVTALSAFDRAAQQAREATAEADRQAAKKCGEAYVRFDPTDPGKTLCPAPLNIRAAAIAGEQFLPYESHPSFKPRERHWLALTAPVSLAVGTGLGLLTHTVSPSTWTSDWHTLAFWPTAFAACYAGKIALHKAWSTLGHRSILVRDPWLRIVDLGAPLLTIAVIAAGELGAEIGGLLRTARLDAFVQSVGNYGSHAAANAPVSPALACAALVVTGGYVLAAAACGWTAGRDNAVLNAIATRTEERERHNVEAERLQPKVAEAIAAVSQSVTCRWQEAGIAVRRSSAIDDFTTRASEIEKRRIAIRTDFTPEQKAIVEDAADEVGGAQRDFDALFSDLVAAVEPICRNH